MKNLSYHLVSMIFLGLLTSCMHSKISESLGDRISLLVEKTVESKKEERLALQELEFLGKQAVPYIVSHLGDMRPLAERAITLKNYSPDRFEPMRHYRPQTVHDALAAILNQITGQHFVFVYNGSDLKERNENIKHWVGWCQLEYPDQAHVCDKAKTNGVDID